MKYFVTGITGTLGQAVLNILLKDEFAHVIGFSRCEQKQRILPKHPRLKLILGDVRDRESVVSASDGAAVIFHFAALKCVDTGEENPLEFIKTNVTGTENILSAQRENKISRVVLSSTDKACYPINSYGATKALAEDLVLQNPNNVVCRYGNVVGSRGSVIPTFVKAIQSGLPISVTNPKMTRFWIRIEDAARFVVESSRGKGGLMIPEMKAATVMDTARSVCRLLGKAPLTHVELTGVRPGEKIHECLRAENEGDPIYSNAAETFMISELDELLSPTVRACL